MNISRTSSEGSFSTDNNWTILGTVGSTVSNDSEVVAEFDIEEVQFSDTEEENEEQVNQKGEEKVDVQALVATATPFAMKMQVVVNWAAAMAAPYAMKMHALIHCAITKAALYAMKMRALIHWAIAKVTPHVSKVALSMRSAYERCQEAILARVSKRTRIMMTRVCMGMMATMALTCVVLLGDTHSSTKPNHLSVIASFPRMNLTAQPHDFKQGRKTRLPLLAPFTYNPYLHHETAHFRYPSATAGPLFLRRTAGINMSITHLTGPTQPTLGGGARLSAPHAKYTTSAKEVPATSSTSPPVSTAKLPVQPVSAFSATTRRESKLTRLFEAITRMEEAFAVHTTTNEASVPPTIRTPAAASQQVKDANSPTAATAMTEKKSTRALSLWSIVRMKTAFAAHRAGHEASVPLTMPMLGGGVGAPTSKQPTTSAKEAPVTSSASAPVSTVQPPEQSVSGRAGTTRTETKRARSLEAIARMEKAFAAHVAVHEGSVSPRSTSPAGTTTKDKGTQDVGAPKREVLTRMPPVKALRNGLGGNRAADMANALAPFPQKPDAPSWFTERALAVYVGKALQPCVPRGRFLNLLSIATSEIDSLKKELAAEKNKVRDLTALTMPENTEGTLVAYKRAYGCQATEDKATVNSDAFWWATEVARENAKLKKEVAELKMQLEGMVKEVMEKATGVPEQLV
eukprot:GEMP01010331.1.p1 GENE.GEMP01010331.1~~GEMP01010331.1.p1  ORF type:complete len:686 (+),score=207.98 GEMP01010331.1:69-2126(+)